MLLIGTAFGFAVAEAGLRVIGWCTPGYYVGDRGPLAVVKPGKHGGIYPPGTDGRLKHYDYDVPWSVNAHGFRERQLTAKRENKRRIGLLGDSFVAGMGVPLSDRFGDVWFASSNTSAHAELWNLATPLCGTACEAAILEGVGQQYQLDELLVAFYSGNDFTDNDEWYRPTATATAPQQSFRDWLREHSRTATFVWVNALRRGARFQPPGVYADSTMERVWPATERALNELLAAADNRPLTLLYIPALPEWSEEAWREARQQWRLSDDGRHLARARLAAWAAQHHITMLDASAWLQGCQPAYGCIFPVDGHWNTKGHQVVARGLAKDFNRRSP
jgi:hypothetical protein